MITKPKIPAYEFEEGGEAKGVYMKKSTLEHFHKSNNTFELFVHHHDFHAMTLYGFNENDAKDMVSKLISVYDIDEYTSHYNHDYGGDGGSGGGG